jgi:hypothetical protein
MMRKENNFQNYCNLPCILTQLDASLDGRPFLHWCQIARHEREDKKGNQDERKK